MWSSYLATGAISTFGEECRLIASAARLIFVDMNAQDANFLCTVRVPAWLVADRMQQLKRDGALSVSAKKAHFTSSVSINGKLALVNIMSHIKNVELVTFLYKTG
jgi:hypothetical protein